eukprot:438228-Prymnesium_polylepis.1
MAGHIERIGHISAYLTIYHYISPYPAISRTGSREKSPPGEGCVRLCSEGSVKGCAWGGGGE